MEEIKEVIREMLQERHENVDFDKEDKLVDGKILDSFDLITLVAELGEEFDIEITAEDFVEKNFNSLDALTQMVDRLIDED